MYKRPRLVTGSDSERQWSWCLSKSISRGYFQLLCSVKTKPSKYWYLGVISDYKKEFGPADSTHCKQSPEESLHTESSWRTWVPTLKHASTAHVLTLSFLRSRGLGSRPNKKCYMNQLLRVKRVDNCRLLYMKHRLRARNPGDRCSSRPLGRQEAGNGSN